MSIKRIAVLGSTGSIGRNTLDVVSWLKGAFEVVGLSANSNVNTLARQIGEFGPKIVSVGDAQSAGRLAKSIPARSAKIVWGTEGLIEIVSRSDVDLIVFALSGVVCLKPLLEAIERRKLIALANKEALVVAGDIVMRRSRETGTKILPIDSEHNAIFQCIEGAGRHAVRRIYLTSSGGPLWKIRGRNLDSISKKIILNHPKWKMGKKITVDSATLMNKGLEIIEARWLFDMDQSAIEVVIHPEAIIHSMVEFVDGAVFAEMATPDMRLPIQYALTYPQRRPSMVKRISFPSLGTLTFHAPDGKRFPCLDLAREALKKGKTYPAVLNAADEEAVKYYLDGKIAFSKIPLVIEKILTKHRQASPAPDVSISDIFDADQWARMEVARACSQ